MFEDRQPLVQPCVFFHHSIHVRSRVDAMQQCNAQIYCIVVIVLFVNLVQLMGIPEEVSARYQDVWNSQKKLAKLCEES